MVSDLGMASSSNQNTQNVSQPSQIFFFYYSNEPWSIKLYDLEISSSFFNRDNRLEWYINTYTSAPEWFISRREANRSTQQTDNLVYLNWRAQDQELLSWLPSSLSEGIISLVLNLDSSFAVWKTIEKKFGVQSHAKVL